MAVWLVRATWMGDEAELTEQWRTNAASPQEAVGTVVTRLRTQPHHVEAKRGTAEEDAASQLAPGAVEKA